MWRSQTRGQSEPHDPLFPILPGSQPCDGKALTSVQKNWSADDTRIWLIPDRSPGFCGNLLLFDAQQTLDSGSGWFGGFKGTGLRSEIQGNITCLTRTRRVCEDVSLRTCQALDHSFPSLAPSFCFRTLFFSFCSTNMGVYFQEKPKLGLIYCTVELWEGKA